MSIDAEPVPVRSLSTEQQVQAVALYRDLLALRAQGVKIALVHLEDELGLRAIGQRRKVSGLSFT